MTLRIGVVVVAAVVAAVVAVGWLAWPKAPGQAVLHTGTARYVVTATVDNPRIGATAVEIDLAGRTGGSTRPATVRIEAVMPLMGHATAPVAAVPAGSGRYHADGVSLMMAGQWELLLSIDSTDGVDQLTLPLTVSG
jgi:hypothetical protein